MIRIGDFQINQRQRDYINEILDNGRLTEGPFVKKLEDMFKEYLGVKHAILVTNGTVALQLVSTFLTHRERRTLNVVVPAMTFPATMNAFVSTGHAVALCDIGEDLQIDIDNIPEEHKENIDVIVPVHLMGYSANMDKIMKEAEKYGWYVIEDTAEAFGAKTASGKLAGTIGDFGTYSFYVSHNVQAGELGLITTNDDEAAEVMRSMKNHGRVGDNLKFLHSYVGSNYKTTEFPAAICYENMERVDDILKTRNANAQYLHDNIKNEKLKPFPVDENFSPLGYPINCECEEYKNDITKKLNDNGVETRNIFPNLASQEVFRDFFSPFDYPVANKLEKTVFYVGVHQFMSEEDLKKIVAVLNE